MNTDELLYVIRWDSRPILVTPATFAAPALELLHRAKARHGLSQYTVDVLLRDSEDHRVLLWHVPAEDWYQINGYSESAMFERDYDDEELLDSLIERIGTWDRQGVIEVLDQVTKEAFERVGEYANK